MKDAGGREVSEEVVPPLYGIRMSDGQPTSQPWRKCLATTGRRQSVLYCTLVYLRG